MYFTTCVVILVLLTDFVRARGGGRGGGGGGRGGGGGGGRGRGGGGRGGGIDVVGGWHSGGISVGGGRGGWNGNSNKPCGTAEECKRQKNEFVLSWVVGFLSLCISSLAFVCCCVVVEKCHSSSRRNVRTSLQQNIEIPTQKNDDFIRQISVEYDNQELDPFKTGFWSLRYNQYGRWHGPYQLLLSFDHALGKVTGKGSDDVGDFTIDGIFSSENVRLGLTQTYKAGTGDPKENFGHTSIIQLNWNSNEKEFQGEWYIQTQTYNGNGELILRFEEYLIPLPDADLEW